MNTFFDSREYGRDSSDDDSKKDGNTKQEYRRRNVLTATGGIGVAILTGFAGTSQASPPPHASAKGWQDKDNSDHDEETTISNSSMQVGLFSGSLTSALNEGSKVEQWTNTGLSVQNLFIPWDNGRYELNELFGTTVPALWQAGRDPMLTWELFLTNGPTPNDILSRVANGEYDDYIADWTDRLNRAATETKVETPTVYIRLAHEMNGDWYPWAPAASDATPETYIAMWRHVKEQVEAQSTDELQLKWVWAANGTDVGAYTMEELYPGDECVDMVAVDCYNWGTSQSWSSWQSPHELFSEPVSRLQSLSDKPIAITEVGTSSLTSSSYDPSQKAAWITDAFAVFDELGVEMCVWFNEDKESDWAVFGGQRGDEQVTIDGQTYEVYSTFADGIRTYGQI